ncbi:MAG: hypothetical protein RI957_694 [Verrucomicrobiota bacterium]
MIVSLTSCGWFTSRPQPTEPNDLPPPLVEIPYAVPVADKPGFVLSPYHNKVVDCQGLARDTLVYDPYDITEPKRKFRVP